MLTQKNSSTKTNSSVIIASAILTISAIIASWPAITFLLLSYANLQGTGTFIVGSFFSLLAVILWISAVSGWRKVYRARTSLVLPSIQDGNSSRHPNIRWRVYFSWQVDVSIICSCIKNLNSFDGTLNSHTLFSLEGVFSLEPNQFQASLREIKSFKTNLIINGRNGK